MAEPPSKQVLVVEDEVMIRIVAADALADIGIMAWEAADAEEALEVLAQRPLIGLVFTDVNLPGEISSLDLAHHVSVLRSDIALIVTSGSVNIPDEKLPDDGTFLLKPYQTKRVVELVAEKLDNAGA